MPYRQFIEFKLTINKECEVHFEFHTLYFILSTLYFTLYTLHLNLSYSIPFELGS